MSASSEITQWRRTVVAPIIFRLRSGTPEPVNEVLGDPGLYEIFTVHGSRIQIVGDRNQAPRRLLRRWPAEGAAASGFDHPGPARMIRGCVARVSELGWAEDTSGSFGSGYRWRFTPQNITFRPSHCTTCERALLLGWCLVGHGRGRPDVAV